MIVPETRLLLLIACGLLPCAVVATVFPMQSAIASTLLLSIPITDAILSRGRLRGISVELAPLLRFVRGREGSFDLFVTRRGDVPRTMRVGLVLPMHLGAVDDISVALPPGADRFRLTSSVNPTHRGTFRLTDIRIETLSKWRFWVLREQRSVETEIRVYPNLFTEKQTAASLLLNRGQIGVHAQRQVGKGREFEKLREYAAGDTYDDIHWRSTARHGRPVTKVYQVERTQEVYAVVDCSRLSGRRADGETAIEKYLTATLLLGLAVQNDGDLFGIIAFSDQIERFVRAGQGRTHYGVCRDALYSLTVQRTSPDFHEVAQFIRGRLRKRSLLVFLTALDDPVVSEDFDRNVRVLRSQHLVMTNIVNSPNVAPLFSDINAASTDEIVDRLSGHLRWHKLKETQGRLHAAGVQVSLIDPDNLGAELVSRYRRMKARQLL